MKRSVRAFGLLFCLFSITGCRAELTKRIPLNSFALSYAGRVMQTDTAVTLYWSGSSVSLTFEQTDVDITLKDAKGNNYFYVMLDGKPVNKINPDTVATTYHLVTNAGPGRHTVTLYKLTECSMGGTEIKAVLVSEKGALFANTAPEHAIEFYGNSITSGYSVDDTLGDSGKPQYFNHFYTYGAIAARHFNARGSFISKSGIGFMVSWFPVIMPELYYRLNPDDSVNRWDFRKTDPEVVVIDLGQNDSWLTQKADHPQFKARFGTRVPDSNQIVAAYAQFVRCIRAVRPKAHIICATGSMSASKEGSPWPGYIEAAISTLEDENISTLVFPYINSHTHPKRMHHQQMAEQLERHIQEKMGW